MKIFKMVNEVRLTNPNLKFNKKLILMHVLLMIIQTSATVANSVRQASFFDSYSNKLQIVMVFADLAMQVAILYICWSMGSSSQLRKFQFTLARNFQGQILLQFRTKETIED